MGTDERCRYGDLLYAMRQLFAFAEHFDEDTDYQLLATMGTAAIHALKTSQTTRRKASLGAKLT